MSSENEKNRVWYNTAILPKLNTLRDLSSLAIDLHSFDTESFFNDFLSDLELLTIEDGYSVEYKIERIKTAIAILKDESFQATKVDLKDIAVIAYLNNSFDRLLFFKQWMKYLKYKKTRRLVSDAAILDAHRFSVLLNEFINEINQRANPFIGQNQNRVA